jgi:hypothetical protein
MGETQDLMADMLSRVAQKPRDITCVKEHSAQIISVYAGTFGALSTLICDGANDKIWPKAWILRI